MKSNKTTNSINRKKILSALWLFAMLTYTYGDVVMLMDPIKQSTVQLSEKFLLAGSIYMMIPLSMVLFSRLLKLKANRIASIIAGIIMSITLTMTLFVGTPTMYYVFFAVIEIFCTSAIVWFAWTWHLPIGRLKTHNTSI